VITTTRRPLAVLVKGIEASASPRFFDTRRELVEYSHDFSTYRVYRISDKR
jgi:hypothetical protein